LLVEAAAAEDGPALRRVERNGRLFPALGALSVDLDLVGLACRLSHLDGCKPTVLRTFAFLAPLRRIQKILFVKECLLAGGPHE